MPESRTTYSFAALGDSGVMVTFTTPTAREANHQVHRFHHQLCRTPFPGFIEAVPAMNSLSIFYDTGYVARQCTPCPSPYRIVKAWLSRLLGNISMAAEHKADLATALSIPVCYDSPYAPDLTTVADYHNLTPEEVVRMHSSADYYVFMLGFAPGFPYLDGMPEQLATPRKSTPAFHIAAGSVGIAGSQTGIYPLASPGGWHIIGRSPMPLFNWSSEEPAAIKPGTFIHFYPISGEEFARQTEPGHEY